MPEVFTNRFDFPSASPDVDTIRAALAESFTSQIEVIEKHEAGFHGAPRDYALLDDADRSLGITLYWEPGRPQIEVQLLEPMDRMHAVIAAMCMLGGTPHDDDAFWRARATARVRAKLACYMTIASAVIAAALLINFLGWWGLLIVLVTAAAIGAMLVYGLARAFGHR
jgi:hypothetical protein